MPLRRSGKKGSNQNTIISMSGRETDCFHITCSCRPNCLATNATTATTIAARAKPSKAPNSLSAPPRPALFKLAEISPPVILTTKNNAMNNGAARSHVLSILNIGAIMGAIIGNNNGVPTSATTHANKANIVRTTPRQSPKATDISAMTKTNQSHPVNSIAYRLGCN
jgi:hypothetical protein